MWMCLDILVNIAREPNKVGSDADHRLAIHGQVQGEGHVEREHEGRQFCTIAGTSGTPSRKNMGQATSKRKDMTVGV